MIGFYYLGVIILWAVISWLIVRAWRRGRQADEKKHRRPNFIVMILFVAWFGGSFWIAFGRNLYWDTRIRLWCAEDGGLVVYETVELPPDQFDEWGLVKFYDPTKDETALGDEYIYMHNRTIIRRKNPWVSKSSTKLYRKSDKKLLGQYIYYSRFGGGISGPAYPSKFKCPNNRGHELLYGIFTKKENKK